MNRTYTLSDGTSLAVFIDFLSERIGQELFRQDLVVALNGRAVREAGRAQIILRDGDIVSVVRAIVGG